MALTEIVEGWTAPMDYDLKVDGSAVDLTGMTVTLELCTFTGSTVTLGGSVALQIATGGRVRYSPATGDFLEGDYRARWKAVDGASKVAYFPSGEADSWRVRLP